MTQETQIAKNVDKFGNTVAFTDGRAELRTNGEPIWFDANSLEQAVELVKIQDLCNCYGNYLDFNLDKFDLSDFFSESEIAKLTAEKYDQRLDTKEGNYIQVVADFDDEGNVLYGIPHFDLPN